MTTALWRASELRVIETTPIWRRKITVFGRSIPISIIALLLFTVVALAAFFSTIIGQIEVSTGAEQSVTLTAQTSEVGGTSSGECALGAGPPAGEFKLKAVGLFPSETCLFSIDVLANGGNTVSVFVGPITNPDTSLAGVVSIDGQTTCGSSLAPGASLNIPFTITADPALVQGTSIGAADLAISFPLSAPSCP